MNFEDFDMDFKILEKVFVTVVRLHIGTNFGKKMTCRNFGLYHKVTISHRGGILIFCQILMKLKNLKFDEIGNFGELRNLDFDKMWKFGIVHQNLIINQFGKISISAFQRHQNHQIWTNFGPQNQNSYITNFVGSRCRFRVGRRGLPWFRKSWTRWWACVGPMGVEIVFWRRGNGFI